MKVGTRAAGVLLEKVLDKASKQTSAFDILREISWYARIEDQETGSEGEVPLFGKGPVLIEFMSSST
jgi:hypothetical protein